MIEIRDEEMRSVFRRNDPEIKIFSIKNKLFYVIKPLRGNFFT